MPRRVRAGPRGFLALLAEMFPAEVADLLNIDRTVAEPSGFGRPAPTVGVGCSALGGALATRFTEAYADPRHRGRFAAIGVTPALAGSHRDGHPNERWNRATCPTSRCSPGSDNPRGLVPGEILPEIVALVLGVDLRIVEVDGTVQPTAALGEDASDQPPSYDGPRYLVRVHHPTAQVFGTDPESALSRASCRLRRR